MNMETKLSVDADDDSDVVVDFAVRRLQLLMLDTRRS